MYAIYAGLCLASLMPLNVRTFTPSRDSAYEICPRYRLLGESNDLPLVDYKFDWSIYYSQHYIVNVHQFVEMQDLKQRQAFRETLLGRQKVQRIIVARNRGEVMPIAIIHPLLWHLDPSYPNTKPAPLALYTVRFSSGGIEAPFERDFHRVRRTWMDYLQEEEMLEQSN